MPRNADFNYKGIKASHSGGWTAQDYHDHNKVHSDKLRKTSEERQMKPRPRSRQLDNPKPETNILDLSTGKKKQIKDSKLQEAVDKDLSNRGLNPQSSINKEP